MGNIDLELERLRAQKLQRLRLGLDSPDAPKKAPRVTVYSTPACPYCHMAKAYLKQKGVSFEEVDVAADAAKARWMVGQTGQGGVPQININGKWIMGFDRAGIDAALEM